MAKQGFINCDLSYSRATFHPFDWSCNRYTEAGEEVVRARVEWRKHAQG